MPCRSVMFLKRYLPLLLFGALAVIYAIFVSPYSGRDLWFDEALTVLNFAVMDSAKTIYNSYFIPNNQILHTILLSAYLKNFPDFSLRFLPVLCALITLALLWHFRLKYGKLPLFISLTVLAVSPPFLIYATALRGYMLSALFTALALLSAEKFARTGKPAAWLLFLVSSIGGVGVMPGTLAALAGVILYVMPVFGNKFLCKPRFYLLASAPAAGFLIFYLPIWHRLLANAALGEGWRDPWAMLGALYGAVVLTFPLLLVMLCRNWRRQPWQHWLIWLLPVPAAFCFKAAPFPRVFFPLFVVWVLVLTAPVKHFFARMRCRFGSKVIPAAALVLTAAALLWGYAVNLDTPVRREISSRLSRGGQDDYIIPHFVKAEFSPGKTVRNIQLAIQGANMPEIFASFASDPWALMFYCRSTVRFDGPRGKVDFLPPGTVVVLAVGEAPEAVEKRFGIRLIPWFTTSQHQVLAVSNE